jgi:hypothetical protein
MLIFFPKSMSQSALAQVAVLGSKPGTWQTTQRIGSQIWFAGFETLNLTIAFVFSLCRFFPERRISSCLTRKPFLQIK